MQLNRTLTNVWCDNCKKDFFNVHARTVGKEGKRVYRVECPDCRTVLDRYKDEPALDPYWRKSKYIEEERRKYWKDFLQPSDPRYKNYYKNPDLVYFEKMEREAKHKWQQRKKQSSNNLIWQKT